MKRRMMAAAAEVGDIDSLAWRFLCSQFTRRDYWDWPLDRRIDAYLEQHDRADILRDATAYGAVIDRVMANIARARRDGKLDQTYI